MRPINIHIRHAYPIPSDLNSPVRLVRGMGWPGLPGLPVPPSPTAHAIEIAYIMIFMCVSTYIWA